MWYNRINPSTLLNGDKDIISGKAVLFSINDIVAL